MFIKFCGNGDKIPITEQSNGKSKNIDILPSDKISKIIYECEEEIFGGYKNHHGIFAIDIISKCLSVSQSINEIIEKNGFTNIVLVGAGTSGRLCRLIAKILKEEINANKINIIPIIAGGIKALIKAEPNTEDNFNIGENDYYRYTKNIDKTNCFLFGISCGLSANYVNGAIQANLRHSKCKSVLIGFNPIEQATINLLEHNNLKVINPIIGPEPIIGSVRMKGGTTTMILLKAIISAGIGSKLDISYSFNRIVKNSKNTIDLMLKYNSQISSLISMLAKTLNNDGQIHILGFSSFGALAIYDAAECPPTFGAQIEQVNGYTENGISELVYFDYERKEVLHKDISFNNFLKKCQNKTNKNDSLLIITDSSIPKSVNKEINNCCCENLFFLYLQEPELKANENNNNTIIFNHISSDIFQKILFVRSLLVNLSTGSFILNGKVYENKMIDLRITNKKLFYRAIRIISEITGFSESHVNLSLQKNIYDGVSVNNFCLSECISIAASKSHIVSKTILALIYPHKSNIEIDAMLKMQPIIRKLIKDEFQNEK